MNETRNTTPSARRINDTTVELTRVTGEVVTLTKRSNFTHIAYTIRGGDATVTFHGSAAAATRALTGTYHQNPNGLQGTASIS
jgi:hypothetical protein